MTLETLCYLSGLEPPTEPGDGAVEITTVACHSRACVPGCIYVCIPGMRVDGHAFIGEALARGAAAVVTERNHPFSDGFVKQRGSAVFLSCDNTRAALAHLYHAWYGQPGKDLRLVAVSGTNGKTTVACMLAAVLEKAGVRTGLIGTLGCFCNGKKLSIRAEDPSINMTTPDPEELYHILSLMVQEGVQTVIMEASSHALALHKLEPLRFDAAVLTNFTQDHLDFHGSMQAYLDAKLHLLELARFAVLNVDDPTFATCRITAPCPIVTAGIAQAADYTAQDVILRGSAGVAFTLCEGTGERETIHCPLPGAFSVSNALLCCACARQLGVASSTLAKALSTFSGVPGRLERVDCGELLPFPVLIDYAHTPDALEKLLLCVRGFMEPQQRLILLFGCGGDRDAGKRPLMASVAARYADVVYLSADNSRSESTETILEDIARGMPEGFPYRRIADRAQAITHAVLHAKAGDIVLLAGKGHERYEINRTGWHPFDEREIVRAAAVQYTGADTPDADAASR